MAHFGEKVLAPNVDSKYKMDDDSVSEDESMSEEEEGESGDESNAESASNDDASENEEGSGQFTKLVEKHFYCFPDLRGSKQHLLNLEVIVKSVSNKFCEQPVQVRKTVMNPKVVKVRAVMTARRRMGVKMMVTMPSPTVKTMTTTEPTLITSKIQSLSRLKKTRLKKRNPKRK